MPRAVDISGVRFGMLTARSRIPGARIGCSTAWECACDCGGFRVASASALRKGVVYSCGCARSVPYTSPLTHGRTGSATYSAWSAMKRRCLGKASTGFHRYGGRGIRICERWRDSFENFLADMGERPEGHTLDRIDVNGNYEPGNCRWATRREQNRNTRQTRLTASLALELVGRREHGEDPRSISRRLGVSRQTVYGVSNGHSWGDVTGISPRSTKC